MVVTGGPGKGVVKAVVGLEKADGEVARLSQIALQRGVGVKDFSHSDAAGKARRQAVLDLGQIAQAGGHEAPGALKILAEVARGIEQDTISAANLAAHELAKVSTPEGIAAVQQFLRQPISNLHPQGQIIRALRHTPHGVEILKDYVLVSKTPGLRDLAIEELCIQSRHNFEAAGFLRQQLNQADFGLRRSIMKVSGDVAKTSVGTTELLADGLSKFQPPEVRTEAAQQLASMLKEVSKEVAQWSGFGRKDDDVWGRISHLDPKELQAETAQWLARVLPTRPGEIRHMLREFRHDVRTQPEYNSTRWIDEIIEKAEHG